ncbi:MAG: dihydrodipicolinate synthase family protein [Thermomicrobiales bacterium]
MTTTVYPSTARYEAVKQRIQTAIAFPVTPFHADYSVDEAGLRHLARFMVEGGIEALVAAGGTGELYNLDIDEWRTVVRATVEEVNRRALVIAGVGFNGVTGAKMAREAQQLGADAILIFPPYYRTGDEDGLFAYYQMIANATELPIIPYSRDNAVLGPRIAERLATIPNAIAYKDGQGSVRNFMRVRQHLGDRFIWLGGTGDDLVPAYFTAGAQGYTSSVANVSPRLALDLLHGVQQGKFTETQELVDRAVVPLYELRDKRRGYEVSAMKAMMEGRGLPGGPVRPPLLDLNAEEKAQAAAWAADWPY